MTRPSYRPLFLADYPGSNQKLAAMRLCMLRSVLLVASGKATKPTPTIKHLLTARNVSGGL